MRQANKRLDFSIRKGMRRLFAILLMALLLSGIVSAKIFAEDESFIEEDEESTKNEKDTEEETVKKEEVVYGAMSPSGKVKNLYVVNSFTIPYDTLLEDHGNYAKVENLTDLNPLQDEDGIISAEVKEGRFYYQGELKKKNFPWSIHISYTLNGKEKDPGMIGGSSGRIGIDIKTNKNPDVDSVYFEKYVLVVSVTLDTDVCGHIKAKGAMVTNTGSDKMLNFISMPGKESSFSLKFKAKNFSMKGISFAAMPATLDKDMFDLDKVSEMTDGLTKLADGISSLNGGAKSLSSGMSEFSSNVGQLGDGLSSLHLGIKQLADGAGALKDGASRLKEGSSQFKAGLDELNEGSDELAAGSGQINNVFQGLKTIAGQFGNLDGETLTKLKDELESLRTLIGETKDGFADLLDKIREGLNFSGFQSISDSESALAFAEISKLASQGKISESTLSVCGKLLSDYLIASSANLLLNNSGQLTTWIDQILEELSAQLENLGDFGIIQPDAIFNISGMIDTFVDQFQQFHEGILAYTGGVKTLAQNYQAIDDGIQGLSDGASGLSGGLDQTQKGTAQMMNGVQSFVSGANALAGGMFDLADGIRELNDQTADMPSEVGKGIDEILGKFTASDDFRPVSFVSAKNGQIDSVQFVSSTEEIEGVKEEEVKGEDSENKGFWGKLIDLFRFKKK